MNIVQAHAQHLFTPLTLMPTFIDEHAQAHAQNGFTPLTLVPTFIHEHAQAHAQDRTSARSNEGSRL